MRSRELARPRPILPIRLALCTAALAFAALGLETTLRVWYRDAGRATLAGPGGRTFVHQTADGGLRGRRDVGARTAGVPRLMVIGDSITYGLGIRDWQQTWPELLVRRLEREGQRHELAVFATPGDDLPQHLETLRRWGPQVEPDVLVYQWYVNDVEALSHRPNGLRSWQDHWLHAQLRHWSYLYFVLDHYLAELLPAPERSYAEYLLSDFASGTLEWAEFERQFHEFATRAALAAPRRLIVLYPQVPFRGHYPLRAIHERMRALAVGHHLQLTPSVWIRAGVSPIPDEDDPSQQLLVMPEQSAGELQSPEYVFGPGPLTIEVDLARLTPDLIGHPIATLALLESHGQPIAAQPLTVGRDVGRRQTCTMTFQLPRQNLQRLRFRLRSTGATFAVAGVRVPVDYGFEVVDLADTLNAFQTHVSAFDAHPNAAAQRVIAAEVGAALKRRPTS